MGRGGGRGMCVGRVGGGGGGGEALDTLQKTFQKGRSSIFTPCSPSPSSTHVAFALCYHLRTVSALLQLCDLISRQLGFFPSHIQPTFKSEASVAAVAQRTSSQRTTHNTQRTTWQLGNTVPTPQRTPTSLDVCNTDDLRRWGENESADSP